MNLAYSRHYAAKIVDWLRDEWTRSEIAGSIRRARPECADVDIVCIPKIQEVKDMFQTVISTRNMVEYFLTCYAGKHNAKVITNGPKQFLIQLPKCQLDLWYADEKTLATRLLCRTGSMQHNIWLATRTKRQGKKWNPYEGILTGGKWVPTNDPSDQSDRPDQSEYQGGHLVQFATEEELYASLDLPFIEPQNREIEYLVKHFGQ